MAKHRKNLAAHFWEVPSTISAASVARVYATLIAAEVETHAGEVLGGSVFCLHIAGNTWRQVLV